MSRLPAVRRLGLSALPAVLIGLMLPACGGSTAPACGLGGEQPHPEIGGEVVFTCYAPSVPGSALYLLDVSTGRVRRLTSDNAWNVDPSWSPDGRRIAYQTTRDGRSNIYVMDVGPGDVHRLTDGRGFNGYPSWSPDGQWIAFESSRDGIGARPDPPGYYRTIYVTRADGTGIHRLLSFNSVSSGPAWSPRGDRIAFSSDRTGAFDLYLVSADGLGLQQLTHHEKTGGSATYPRWSADGSRLVFGQSMSAEGHGEVYWMAPDQGEPSQVTADQKAQWEGWPDWSPDGQWIVFTRAASSHQLYAVHPDGTDLTQLTADPGDKDLPRWRP